MCLHFTPFLSRYKSHLHQINTQSLYIIQQQVDKIILIYFIVFNY